MIDVIFGDAEANTYKYEPRDKLLDCWEKKQNYNHSKNYHKKQRHFSPFVLSVYGMTGKEVLFVLSYFS